MIEIDGSYGEGGGQLLRLTIACAAVRGLPVRIRRIRAGRPQAGLAAQHLTAVRAVASLCCARTEGLALGSQELTFAPGPLVAGRFRFDVATAGSVTLVLQACLVPALFAPGPVELTITGGTDVRWSPPWDYARSVLAPLLERLGVTTQLELGRRGYYPQGGGRVTARTAPVGSLKPLQLEGPGRVQAIRGIAHVANLPPTIAGRMAAAAATHLGARWPVEVESCAYGRQEACGQGGAIVLWAETEQARLGASSLAERGVTAERVGEEAASRLRAELAAGAALDIQAADQLLPYLALATGPSHFTVRQVSRHLATLAWLLPQLLDCQVALAPEGELWRVTVLPPRSQ